MPIARAAQDFVPIKEIRDGIIVLKDGGLRAILMASSINLSLKSTEEQRAILAQFQSFLNSINFSLQIVIRSRKYDIRPYLATLENRLREIEEPLLKIQTREYIFFIRNFTETINIMTKNFFVVVPYTGATLAGAEPLAKLKALFTFGKKESTPGSGEKKSREEIAFEEKQTQILQRIGVIQQGLARLSIRTVQLGTEEVVELFFKTFNPGEITGIKFEQ